MFHALAYRLPSVEKFICLVLECSLSTNNLQKNTHSDKFQACKVEESLTKQVLQSRDIGKIQSDFNTFSMLSPRRTI